MRLKRTLVLLREVKRPVRVEAAARSQRAQPQDGPGAVERPARTGPAPAILHEVAARALDHAGRDRQAGLERAVVVEQPNQQFAAILPASHATPGALPDGIITYGPIVLKPDEPRSWQDRMSGTDAPPGSSIRYGNTIDRLTVAGWPLHLVECEVMRGATDEVIEVRLCAFYTFMDHAAVAIVHAATRDRLEANGMRTRTICMGINVARATTVIHSVRSTGESAATGCVAVPGGCSGRPASGSVAAWKL